MNTTLSLIIDDIGYVQQSREEMEVLFTLIADRYERTSLLISSNLPFSKWEQIFKDPMTTAAAIDRLVHHSTIIERKASCRRTTFVVVGRGRGGSGLVYVIRAEGVEANRKLTICGEVIVVQALA